MKRNARAVFLDRDGVLVPEGQSGLELQPFSFAAEAVARLRRRGFLVVVVTNQPAVARGLCSEADVVEAHARLRTRVAVDAFYHCPHHPHASRLEYRIECDCRKPRAGLLRRAADELEIALDTSFLVGDRPSDILAGARAGCTTILVHSGAHLAAPIVTPDPPETRAPDHECADLAAAVELILAS